MNARRGRWALPTAFIAGVFCAHQCSQLPPGWIILGGLLGGLASLLWSSTRVVAVWLLAASWTLWQFSLQLDQRLAPELSGQTLWVEGRVSDMPESYSDFSRFRFQPLTHDVRVDLPANLLVYWYRGRPEIEAGQTWRLQLQLKPPWGRVNFSGADREQWLFSERIGALGTVRQGELLSVSDITDAPIQQIRNRVRERISQTVPDERAESVLRALAVADRSGLSASDRELLVATGTAHLLAISGLHIGLAAVAGTWLTRTLLALSPAVPFASWGFRLALTGGLLAAIGYAALAGWGVSTQRALIMITVLMLALMVRRAINPVRSFLLALCAVLLFNPLAPLGAGFWFSFLAVGALIVLFVPRPGAVTRWKSMLLAQAGIMAAMVPVSIGWFQVFSPVGFLANLAAIPAVSFIIVPLVLAGIALMPVSTLLAGVSLKLAAFASSVLLWVLEFFSGAQGNLPLWPEPGPLSLVMATFGGFLLLLPRGFPQRWVGLFFCLPLFLPPVSRSQEDSMQMEVLDVGQGTAVLLGTPNHNLLYDSGPGDGHGMDLVRSVIVPAVTQWGIDTLDTIVISHGDLDHAGGIQSLATRYRQAHWVTSLRRTPAGISSRLTQLVPAHEACGPQSHWTWDGIEFRTLSPSYSLPYRGNDSSCVLSVGNETASVLLAGDISSAVEKRLIAGGLTPYRVLLVPHHGSKTSSSEAFISRVQPQLAIATAGLGNRFGLPRPSIRERYLAMNSQFLSTADCGGIRLQFDETGQLHIESARRAKPRIWRWPAAEGCP